MSNPLVVKIYDKDCPDCKAMHNAEMSALREYGTDFVYMETAFAALHLDILKYVEMNVVDDEGELQLPVYIFYDNEKRITGHYCGLGTYHDICGHPVSLD